MSLFLSYLMGADNIQDKDLNSLKVVILEKTDNGHFKIQIPSESLSEYILLIKEKLNNGFWNEIIGSEEIVFIFKFKDGSSKDFKLSPENESEISKLCTEFNNEPAGKTNNVYKYLSESDFYHDLMVENYFDLINRE